MDAEVTGDLRRSLAAWLSETLLGHWRRAGARHHDRTVNFVNDQQREPCGAQTHRFRGASASDRFPDSAPPASGLDLESPAGR